MLDYEIRFPAMKFGESSRAFIAGQTRLHRIDQFGDVPPGVTAPACRVRDRVINMAFRPADDHRAAAVAHDINGDLPHHAGIAADNCDLPGLRTHIRGVFMVLLTAPTGPPFLVSTTRTAHSWAPRKQAENRVVPRLRPVGVSCHHPEPPVHPGD